MPSPEAGPELPPGFVLAEMPPAAREALESALDQSGIELGPTAICTHPQGCDVLVDASWTESNDEHHTEIRRTLLFFHRPQARLPEFELIPRQSLADRMALAMFRFAGVPTLDLDGEPEFSKRFLVITANPESARVLLGRDTIDAFLACHDLRTKFFGRGAIVHRVRGDVGLTRRVRDERLDGPARRQFVADARLVASAIVDDPEASRRAVAAVPGSYGAEAKATYERSGGFIGRAVRGMLVTAAMVESLREQPPPRRDIPAPIARRAWRGTHFPLLVVGGLGLGFVTMGTIGILTARPGTDNLIGGIVFSIVGTLALVATGFIIRHRSIRKRMVRWGTVASGSVETVEATDTSINNDRIHRITFTLDGESEARIAKMGSAAARAARRLRDSGGRTWVLVDPKSPARVLWPQGWVIDAKD